MSDIYSLSMVIVEVRPLVEGVAPQSSNQPRLQLVTGKVPFPEYTDENVIVMIAKGGRPSRPRSFEAPGMTPEVWRIATKCWDENADQRPEASAVLQLLEPLSKSGVYRRAV